MHVYFSESVNLFFHIGIKKGTDVVKIDIKNYVIIQMSSM